MGGSFESSDGESKAELRPLRLPTLKGDLYGAAKELIDDLAKWSLVSEDEDAGVLVCSRAGGFLGGKATVTIRFEAPEGVPSTTVRLRSETEGGLMPRDKANVVEFMKPYNRRVC